MDKNSLTGAILIVLIWIVFSTFFLNVGKDDSIDIDKNQSLYEQSNTSEVKNENQNYIKKELEKKQSNIFNHLKNGENGVEVLENEKIKLLVNRKGGNIESVFIKEYKTYNGEPLDLFSKNSKLNLQFFNKDIINTERDEICGTAVC